MKIHGVWYWRVRAIDAGGTAGWWSWTDNFSVDTVPPTAEISNAPDVLTNQEDFSLIVCGTGVSCYKYKLDGGSYSSETAVENPIDLSGLSDGVHTLSIIGRDSAGNWQSEAEATVASWTVDTVAPEITGLSNDPNPTQSKTWTWDVDETATFRYRIDQDDTWTPSGEYGETKTATKNNGSGTWYLHVQAKDAAGNESGVVSASVNLYTQPSATTGSATSMTLDSAIINGNVDPNSDAATVIFEYGITENYGKSINATETPVTGNDEQPVNATLTGLDSNTSYHFRVKATNRAGTTYGEDEVFNTIEIPDVETTPLSSITSTTAVSGGNIYSDGGASITGKGVCWSTSANPTISNNKTIDGTGTNGYLSSITGLIPGRMYHVRAYATNAGEATGYGRNMSFQTSYGSTFYVSKDGNCGAKDPCRDSIQEAIDDAVDGSLIKVKAGTYEESLSVASGKTIQIKGGYDSVDYNNQVPNTTIIDAVGATRITPSSSSALKFQMIRVK